MQIIRKLSFLSFLLFLFSHAFSQKPSVHWGNVEKGVKGMSQYYKFLGIQNDKYYFVHKPESDNILVEYDMNHNVLSETEFDYIKNKQRLKIHGAIETVSGSYIYSHQLSTKYKEWIIHKAQLNNGRFTEPQEAYFQEIDISKGRLSEQYRNYKYDFGDVNGGLIMSEDSTKVAFVNIFKRDNHTSKDVVAIAVMDDKLNLIWKDIFYFKFSDPDIDIVQEVVTNEGEIYLISKERRKNDLNGKVTKIKDKKLPRHTFTVYSINQEGILDYRIDLGNNIAPTDARIFFPRDETNTFSLLGFYGDNQHRNRVKGMYFTTGDNTLEGFDFKIHPFQKDLLVNLVRTKDILKDKGLQANYDIKDMIEYADGTIGFIAEENYETTQYYNDGFNTVGLNRFSNTRNVVTTTYFSNSILLPRFDIYGDLIDIQLIQKSYASLTPAYISYSMAQKDGRTYLVFNDFKNKDERKKINKKGRRFTDMVVINGVGAIESRETIFSDREIELEFISSLSDFNDKYFLIGSIGNRRYCMGRIDLK